MDYKNLYEAFTKKVRSHVDMVSAHAAASTIRELSAGDSKKKALDAFDVEMRKLHSYVQEQTEHLSREMLRNETLSEMMEAASEEDTLRKGGGSTLRIDPSSPSQGTRDGGLRRDPGAPRKGMSDAPFSDTSKNQQQLIAYSSDKLPSGDPMADRDSEAAFRGGGDIGGGPDVTIARSAGGETYGSWSGTPGQGKSYSQNQNSVLQWGRDIMSGKNQVDSGVQQEVQKLMGNYDTFKNDKTPMGSNQRERLVAQIDALRNRTTANKENPASDPQQLTPADFEGPNPRAQSPTKGGGAMGAPAFAASPQARNQPSEDSLLATAMARVDQGSGLMDVDEKVKAEKLAQLERVFGDVDEYTAMVDTSLKKLAALNADEQKELRQVWARAKRDLEKKFLSKRDRQAIVTDTDLSLKAFQLVNRRREQDLGMPQVQPQLAQQGSGSGRYADNIFDYLFPEPPSILSLGTEEPGQMSTVSGSSDMEKNTASLLNKVYSTKKGPKGTPSQPTEAEPNSETDRNTKPGSGKSPSSSRLSNIANAARKSMQRSGGSQGDLSATDIVDASAKANEVGGGGGRSNTRNDLGSALGELKRKIRRLAKKRKDSNDEQVKEKLSREIEKLQDDLEKLAISLQDS